MAGTLLQWQVSGSHEPRLNQNTQRNLLKHASQVWQLFLSALF